MSRHVLSRLLVTSSLLASGLFTLATPSEVRAAPPSSSSSTGTISGEASDGDSGEPLANVAVVLSCACLDQEIQVFSNDRGIYAIHGLPAGLYTVQGLFDTLAHTRTVELTRGASVRANLRLQGDRRVGPTEITVTSPLNPHTPSTGSTLSSDELRGTQGGSAVNNDAISGAMDTVATANDNGPRRSMVGLSEVEQNYAVNGHAANDPTMGAAGAAVISEFVQEVQILEAGYEAEYGSASGGQINVRRLAGTNELRGIAGLRFSPRLAEPRFIVGTDEALRVTQTPDYGGAAYVALSGPIIEDRLFFSLGLNFAGAKHTLTQSFYHRVDIDESGGYADCPYENGTNDCVAGGSYIASEKFAEQRFKTGGAEISWLGGLDWRIRPRHTLGLTVLGGPSFSRTSYRLPFSVDPVAFGTNPDTDLGGSARIATGIVNDHFGWNYGISNLVGLEYHGRVLDDKMEIDAQVSYWQGTSEMAWRLDDPSLKDRPATQETTANGRNLIEYLDSEGRTNLVPGVEQACNDSSLPGNACPVRTWVSGGLGQYDRDVSRRVQGSLAFTRFVDARRGGNHQIKWGAETSWLQRQSDYRYSGSNDDDFMGHGCEAGETAGGEYCYNPLEGYSFSRSNRVNNNRFMLVDGNNPDQVTTFGYGTVRHETGELRALADPLGRGARVDGYQETLSTMNYGLYLQDRWAILPNLVVSAGARWEIQDMRDIYGRSQVRIWDNIAPRVGVVYDWTNEGRSRLYASYGWFFQPLPLQLNSRAFGGLVQVGRSYKQSDCANQFSNFGADPRTSDDKQPTEWCVDSGGFTSGLTGGSVAPGLKGPYNQQFQLGYEQELIEDLVVNLRWLHQDLGRAVEDVSTNGGLDFIIANPGEGVAQAEIAAQEAACEALQGQIDGLRADDDRQGQLARELQRCDFLSDSYRKLGSMYPKPVRTLDAWTLQLTRRLARGWSVRASYTYSRNLGNYDGYVDPTNGSINLGASTQYDVPELVRNSFGPLSGTVPHMVNLDGIYSIDLRQNGRITLAANLRYRSGVPVSVRTDTALAQYRGNYLIYLLPRGAGGRVEDNYRVNLTASYTYPLANDLELEIVGRIINVSNARAVLRVDEVYSFESARPIAGGELGDLKHAKLHRPGGGDGFFDRQIVRPQGNYGVETRFQQPVSAQFELALRF